MVETGSTLMEMLIKKPVKDAVREALAEERVSEATRTADRRERGSDERGESSDGGGRGGTIGRILLLALLAGAAYYAQQRRGMDVGTDLTEEVVGGGADAEEPAVEDPLSAESDESQEGTSEEQSDEGPATQS